MKDILSKVLAGEKITKCEALSLVDVDLKELSIYADKIRQKFCGNKFDMCSIINGKSGRCSENCKYCAQSVYYNTDIKEYPLLDTESIFKEAKHNADKKVGRFAIVTSGRALTDEEIENVYQTYKEIKSKCNIKLCASMGLLSYENFIKLKQAGVSRYHCNLETSRNFFHNICTTHTYDDKINTIKIAQRAGLEVCSGGILGLGESFEDRIDMFFDLATLGIKSIPVNVLNTIKNTPFENNKILSCEEVARSIAIARFILPDAFIRLAGGRKLFKDKGKSFFLSGANATITGDMLTTEGITIDEDFKIMTELGFI